MFLLQDWFPLEIIYRCNISVMWWEINSEQSISTWVHQKKIKSSTKERGCSRSRERGLNFDPRKTFSENYKPMEFLIIACSHICRELLSLAAFIRVHSNSEEVSYFSWQNTYSNLKTACRIKLKFFLWTKNLLLAKYLIFVATLLNLKTYDFHTKLPYQKPMLR